MDNKTMGSAETDWLDETEPFSLEQIEKELSEAVKEVWEEEEASSGRTTSDASGADDDGIADESAGHQDSSWLDETSFLHAEDWMDETSRRMLDELLEDSEQAHAVNWLDETGELSLEEWLDETDGPELSGWLDGPDAGDMFPEGEEAENMYLDDAASDEVYPADYDVHLPADDSEAVYQEVYQPEDGHPEAYPEEHDEYLPVHDSGDIYPEEHQPEDGHSEVYPAEEKYPDVTDAGKQNENKGRTLRRTFAGAAVRAAWLAAAAVICVMGFRYYAVRQVEAARRRVIAAAAPAAAVLETITPDDMSAVARQIVAARLQREEQRRQQEELERQEEEKRRQEQEEQDRLQALRGEAGTIPVDMALSSVQSDLKVKIRNASTKSLIAGEPFRIQVKFPDGTTAEYEDDDQDGIIYRSPVAAGNYTVTLLPLVPDTIPENATFQEQEAYLALARYSVPAQPGTLTVVDQIKYEKVDVADEVKSESQINKAAEDTARNDTVVESKIEDTVEWTESTQEVVNEPAAPAEQTPAAGTEVNAADYEEVPKADIPDPYLMAGLPRGRGMVNTDWRLLEEAPQEVPQEAQADTGTDADSGQQGDTAAAPAEQAPADTGANEAAGQPEESAASETAAPPEVKMVLLDASSISAKVGDADVTVKASVTWTDGTVTQEADWTSSDTAVATVSGGVIHFTGAGTATITATKGTHSESCKVSVSEAENTGSTIYELYLRGVDTLTVGSTQTIIPVVLPEAPFITEWTSKNTDIASVDENGAVTGLKPGKATIECTVRLHVPDAAAREVTGTCSITVEKDSSKAITVNVAPIAVTLAPEKTQKLSVRVDNANDTSVTFQSDNEQIATVSEDGTITAKAEGDTLVTVTSREDTSISTQVSVKVASAVDENALLKDANGNQLYVKENGVFREALVKDYRVFDSFYRKKGSVSTIKYTGWQTIGGHTYYYDKDGKPVTGTQTIQGVTYTFSADGILNANTTLCVDVSSWNGKIDWQKVKASGVTYAIIRCGYRGSKTGVLVQDSMFRTNISGAIAAGLKVGVYFYSQAINEAEAVDEASMVLDTIKGYSLSLPVFLDVEASGGRGDQVSVAQRTAVIQTFCKTIANYGYTAGVYANTNWFSEKINTNAVTNYHIWLAQYAAKPSYTRTRYDIWQYTDKGRVSGMSGDVDMDIVYRAY